MMTSVPRAHGHPQGGGMTRDDRPSQDGGGRSCEHGEPRVEKMETVDNFAPLDIVK